MLPCPTARVTMAGVSFSNLHPDFRLSLLLVVAALLLAKGSFGTVWALLASDRLGPTSVQYGWLTAAFDRGSRGSSVGGHGRGSAGPPASQAPFQRTARFRLLLGYWVWHWAYPETERSPGDARDKFRG